jgi:cytoskeletal protein CcmA (bactofilin family)
MFKNKPESSKNPEFEINSHNTIGAGTVINGEINIEGNVRIDGTINGNVISTGKIVLGPSGTIIGEIECKQVTISGNVKGRIIAHELISVKATANLDGDVFYNKIEVDNGAIINGSLISNVKTAATLNNETAQTSKSEKKAVVYSSN